ncbi:hypothetical protein JTE90_016011 [Oedothorax gibbosus]|uniref:Uncharacterized protein n=1 Tax=Oedothorax gibbosus TaxID=931172 RepID=A0AAV6VQR7_9ARAC|nr:hypothetical protein JTE90_016011 [Oedothorax gibbosus]
MALLLIWTELILALTILPKIILTVDSDEDNDSRRPIWNIAHMVNALHQVDEYLDRGANSLEFDIAFDPDGEARFTYHGVPCDCFRRCTRYEDFDTYLDYLRQLTTPGDPRFRKELILLFMDLKVSGLSQGSRYRAGEDVAKKLLENYWKKGTSIGRAYILVSLPSINHLGFVRGFRNVLQNKNATEYEKKIGFDFSGNEDINLIRSTLASAGINDNIWIGDGITNCLPRGTSRLVHAISKRDDSSRTNINKVYWWTVDKMSTMRRTLEIGVDGLITNHPERLKDVLDEGSYSSFARLATFDDNPWKTYSRKVENIMARGRGRLFADEAFENDTEEILYNT